MAKTTVDLPPGLHRKLRVKAAVENSSMNDIIVTAVTEYLHNFQLDPGLLDVETRPSNGTNSQTIAKER